MPLDDPKNVFQELLARIAELNQKGAQFMAQEDFEAARLHFMAAAQLDSNNPDVLSNLAASLYRLRKYETGAMVARRAVTVAPNHFMAWNNLAINLVTLGRNIEGRAAAAKGLALNPTDRPLHHTLGSLFLRQNKFAQAEEAFKKAISLGYDAYATRNDLGLALISQAKLEEGLAEYEVRWQQLYQNPIWVIGMPEWKGEDLASKSILVHSEQGYGDSIMLCRFLEKIRGVCPSVALATQKPLIKLLEHNFPGLEIFDVQELPVEILSQKRKFDFHTPMLSMMRHLKIKKGEISSEPYLSVDKPLDRPLSGRYKIGICWSSGDHAEEMQLIRRRVPLEKLLKLGEIPGVRMISLQKGRDSQDIYSLGAEALVIDPMPRISSFYDTARVIREVDIVVAVCTSVAHLAGAMGKKCFVMLQKPRFWAYWDSPKGTPWYQDYNLYYREEETHSWDSAVARIIRDVKNHFKIS